MSKAAELAALIGGTSGSSLSNRNLIINGAMQVWQRGTIITGKTSGNNFIADRHYLSLGSAGTWTIEQSTDAPVGFKYSLKYTCTSSVTLSGGNYAVKQYNPEGQDMKHLEFGTSNAKTLTISFWVKSSLSGDFGFAVRNNAGNKCIVKSYTISSANTWEYKTININPATDGTWPDDNGQFGVLNFDLGVGPTYSTTSSNSYTTSNKFGLTGGVKIAETTNATWQITGIQLEIGEQATPFEHRSFGDELARCQRYYQKSYSPGVFPGATSGLGIGASIMYRAYGTGQLRFSGQFKQSFRDVPTVTAYSPYSGNSAHCSENSSITDKNIGGAQASTELFYAPMTEDCVDGRTYEIAFEAESEL